MHNTRKTCLFLLVLALFLLAPSFAMAQGGQISGYAWYDTEGDRTYSEGDRTLGRVTAVLYRSVNGTEEQIGKITTGTDGMYAFTGLAAGEYRLSVTLPDEHNFILPQAGGSIILPGCGTVSSSPAIILADGQVINNAHIGVSKSSGYIKAYVFSDDNANGGRRTSEEMLRYVSTDLLYEYNGEWVVVDSIKTDKDGCATYWDLTPGVYRIAVTLPDPYIIGPMGEKMTGWYNCIPPADSPYGVSDPFEVPRSGSVGIGIGAVKTGSLTGSIWYDANCNGLQDAGEGAFQGATVQLNNAAAGVSRTLMSNTDGSYTFEKLLEGEYTLTVSLPDSYMFTLPGGESLFTDGTAFTQSITASVSMEKNTSMQKIGVMPVTTLTVALYNDLNGNAELNNNEMPFAGATLEILDGETLVASAISDGDGRAYIPILRGGTLSVRCTLPAGQVFTIAGPLNDFVSLAGENSLILSYDVQHGQDNKLRAGVTVPASISGKLFDDNNVTGILDNGEGGLAGFTVQAIDERGQVAAQTVTDENGNYYFDSLLPQTHTIRFLLADAYVFSDYADLSTQTRNQVVLQTADYGETDSIALVPGQMVENICGGSFRSATIAGNVFRSAGLAAEQLSGGIENVWIQLLTEDGIPVSDTTATYTEADGSFYLKGALPGTYRLEFTLPAGHSFVEPLLDSEIYTTEPFTLATADDLVLDTLLATPVSSYDGVLYCDSNVNGVYDAGESTLSGIVIQLLNNDYGMLYETRTLDSGEFYFSALRPGAYTLSVSLPEDLCFAFDAASLLAPTTANTASADLTLYAGQQLPGSNIAAATPAQLSGTVYFDLANNNLLDTADMGAAGIMLTLQSIDAAHFYTCITDENGAFDFSSIVPGNYNLLVSLTSDCIPADGNPAVLVDGFYQSQVRVEDGASPTLTYAILRYAAMSGRVWSMDQSLKGVNGRTVTLFDANGTQLAQTQTDETGAYRFVSLKPGRYTISCDLPDASYLFARTLDAQVTPSIITRDTSVIENDVGRSALLNLAMGEDKTDCHIGIGAMGKLGDTAWLDENANGLQDKGEKGLPGVVVNLYQYGEKVAETITDGYGHYLFTGLFPGKYTVEVVMPEEVKTTAPRTDYPMVSSVLPESEETTVRAENIIVPSGSRNLNCDFGFVLRKEGKYPASLDNLPQTNWDYKK